LGAGGSSEAAGDGAGAADVGAAVDADVEGGVCAALDTLMQTTQPTIEIEPSTELRMKRSVLDGAPWRKGVGGAPKL
jgi:hypothetical protein